MNKNTALWVMLIGGGMSLYDLMTTEKGATAGALYGTGKPLAGMRWNFYSSKADATATPAKPAKDYYLSISDAAALAGAWFYFR